MIRKHGKEQIMYYAYLRVSTDKQDERNQKVGIDAYAKEHDIKYEKTFIEHISGTVDVKDRILSKLLKKVKKDDTIIISEISRFGRKLYMLFCVMDELLNKGVHVYSIKEGWELNDTIQSKVMAFAYGMSAEIERNMIATRTKEALQRKKREGIKLGRKIGSKVTVHKIDKFERHIRNMLAKGKSKAAICRKIKVSPKTLRNFLKEKGLLNECKKVRNELTTQPTVINNTVIENTKEETKCHINLNNQTPILKLEKNTTEELNSRMTINLTSNGYSKKKILQSVALPDFSMLINEQSNLSCIRNGKKSQFNTEKNGVEAKSTTNENSIQNK